MARLEQSTEPAINVPVITVPAAQVHGEDRNRIPISTASQNGHPAETNQYPSIHQNITQQNSTRPNHPRQNHIMQNEDHQAREVFEDFIALVKGHVVIFHDFRADKDKLDNSASMCGMTIPWNDITVRDT
ncbi:hypothetical protein B0A55_02904 [Friedmanniomyces simplex]|uniref:Uncharacterized protein n=1 Tax=Friedmanniomyces simplex TaxID=329884 RepID=A0A4U0XVV8_9PEZI|nr:hypothetical protein B0A55_02904 [Friedmanniomyces simplex]